MGCSETREYLFAFLDNELDAPLSIELQMHLERCHDCAREVEIERAIRRQLGCALEQSGNQPSLDDKTLRRTVEHITTCEKDSLADHSSRRKLRWWASRRAFLATGIAAAIVMVPTLWLALRGRGDGLGHNRLADLVVEDFEHFLENGQPLQIESSDRRSVSDWLYRQTALAVVLPVSHDSRCKLLGGRKCKIGGRAAAFAAYEMDGVPASLVVLPGEQGELDEMDRVVYEGRTHWVDRCKGHTVTACRRGELVYVAVSTLPEEELVFLMSNE